MASLFLVLQPKSITYPFSYSLRREGKSRNCYGGKPCVCVWHDVYGIRLIDWSTIFLCFLHLIFLVERERSRVLFLPSPCTLYLHSWYFLRKQFRSIPRLIDSVKRAVSPTERIYGPDLVLNCSSVPRDLLQIALQLFCAIVRLRSSLKRR